MSCSPKKNHLYSNLSITRFQPVTIFGESKKERLCKCLMISNLQNLFCASGGTRTRTAFSGQGIFLPLWLSPPVSVCGPDYSFTVDLKSLGVSCLVSAPSSRRRLGSRLPSALPVKASLTLRQSTSLLSERALKLRLSPSCLPFHHQGVGAKILLFWLSCNSRILKWGRSNFMGDTFPANNGLQLRSGHKYWGKSRE